MNSIKSAKIFYFSGTGNAKQIAEWFCTIAIEKNIGCQMYCTDKTNPKSLSAISPDTLLIFISPIHGFNFPKIMLDFIRHFPLGKNNIVLMNTRAGMRIGHRVTPGLTGIAFLLSSFLLRKKGYKIVGQIPFDMPSNWVSIHPALGKKTVKFLHKENLSRVRKHADKIFSGKPDFLAHKDLVQDILISPVSLAYYFVGRFFLAKSCYASANCNQCGLCEKQCPVQAIKNSHSQPFWTFRCESCMRCMKNCPQRAIETTHGLWMVLFFLSSTATGLLYAPVANHIQSILIKITLFSVVLILLLWILYRAQHLLLRNKFIRKWIVFTSLTHYKFWGKV